jgi:hypothetical protein
MVEKKICRFADIQNDILKALKDRSSSLAISEPVTLIDGFITEPYKSELTGEFTIGGPTIPMVMLVGRETGRVYLFALRALLPELSL